MLAYVTKKGAGKPVSQQTWVPRGLPGGNGSRHWLCGPFICSQALLWRQQRGGWESLGLFLVPGKKVCIITRLEPPALLNTGWGLGGQMYWMAGSEPTPGPGWDLGLAPPDLHG